MLVPYTYHPSRIIDYSSTHFVLFDHHYYLLLIITVFPPHTSVLMADANVMYHPSVIIYYSSTHYLLFGFHHIFHFLMDDANAILFFTQVVLLINTLRII